MKKLTFTSLAICTLATACGPYPPGDCRYNNYCQGHVYKEGGTVSRPVPEDSVVVIEDRRYYRNDDDYYYDTPDYTGYRYVYHDGYMQRYDDADEPPVGGWNKPDGPDRHPSDN